MKIKKAIKRQKLQDFDYYIEESQDQIFCHFFRFFPICILDLCSTAKYYIVKHISHTQYRHIFYFVDLFYHLHLFSHFIFRYYNEVISKYSFADILIKRFKSKFRYVCNHQCDTSRVHLLINLWQTEHNIDFCSV